VLVFEERGKPEYPEKNLSEQGREPTTNSTHMASTPGVKPSPHWWEASALTTAPPLLPSIMNTLLTLFLPRDKVPAVYGTSFLLQKIRILKMWCKL